MTDSLNTDANDHAREDRIPESLQRLRDYFSSSDSEHQREGLELLDELEKEWRSGVPHENHEVLNSALRHAEQTLHHSTNRDESDDLFLRAMHSLEAAMVDLETTLPVAARLMKRIAGLISNIGI